MIASYIDEVWKRVGGEVVLFKFAYHVLFHEILFWVLIVQFFFLFKVGQIEKKKDENDDEKENKIM